MTIRLMVADDHPLAREGAKMIFANQENIEAVIEAKDGAEAIELADKHHPDVILMDITMPGTDGVEATRQIRARFPGINVIAMTVHENEEMIKKMLEAGAIGYLTKDSGSDEYIDAVNSAMKGDRYLSKTANRHVIDSFLDRGKATQPFQFPPDLNETDTKLLKLLVRGKYNKQIAASLQMSERSLERKRSELMRKFSAQNIHELILKATQLGIVS